MSVDQSRYLEYPRTRRAKIAVLLLWFAAACVYTAAGLWVPWVFLLGFWQATLAVVLVTLLTPIVVRRFQ